jgi:hypothetical protein
MPSIHCTTCPHCSSRAWRLLLSVIVAVGILGAATVANAAYQFTRPSDLAPDAPYQLLFTTEHTIRGYDPNLLTYQNFVQNEAANNAFLPDAVWNPIAFIYNNPSYLPSLVAKDVPLYNLLGQRLLDHASDLFTSGVGEWINGSYFPNNAVYLSHNITWSNGAPIASATQIWTGTDYANAAASYTQLGNNWYGYANFALYQPGSNKFEWKNSGGYNYDSIYASHPLLAMSGVIVPEPTTIIVWSMLGAITWLGMRVWRRRGTM